MKTLDLSIVVPVSKDERILNCLASIDANVEIVVVLNNNPSDEVIKIVNNDGRCKKVFVSKTKKFNLAKTLNLGIAKSVSNNILIINSDCRFPSGLLQEMIEKINKFEVVKSRVVCDYQSFNEFIVARSRYQFSHLFNEKRNLYGPGMMFRKNIIKKLGGYFFDEDIGWAEDADLSQRIYRANLSVFFINREVIHAPEGIVHDLKIAFVIGKGKRLKDLKKNINISQGNIYMLTDIVLDRYHHLRSSYKNEGLIVTLYLIIWKILYLSGYFNQSLKLRKVSYD